MIIINIIGGLGNQMFQYALGIALREKGRNVLFDISEFNQYELHNGYELERLFHIDEKYADQALVKSYINKNKNKMIKRYDKFLKLFGKSVDKKYEQHMKHNFDYLSNVQLYELDEVYINGYWQSEMFFKDVKNQIIDKFNFDFNLDEKNAIALNDIKTSDSISIHVRRGDYVNHNELGGICDIEYYKKAIEYVQELVTSPKFYIFSNDIEWCRANLQLKNVMFIDWNSDKESYKDMLLMSHCKHNIIANSSFSWWGAYLNKNPNKRVVAPSKWFKNSDINDQDVIPNEWIKI
jgi:hypothetical protein